MHSSKSRLKTPREELDELLELGYEELGKELRKEDEYPGIIEALLIRLAGAVTGIVIFALIIVGLLHV